MRRNALAFTTALLMAGCVAPPPDGSRSPTTRVSPPSAEALLIAEDVAFALDAKQRGVAAAFAARMHPEGKLISPGAPIAIGPAGVQAALANDRSDWTWAPEEAAVSGDLGVTWGHATISYRTPAGEAASLRTRYVTAWKRDAAGNWKVWLDIGNQAPGPSELLNKSP